MTADDVIDLIDVMANAWPWAEWTGKQTDLWCGALADLERQDAAVAVRRAVRKLDKPPSIAWVLGEARSEAERRNFTAPALEAGPVDKDRRAELMALMRERLSTPKEHDHHNGWEGCATCVEAVKRDGLNPPPTRRRGRSVEAPRGPGSQDSTTTAGGS